MADAQCRPTERKQGFSYYSTKEFVMAKEAQCGVMLWDAKHTIAAPTSAHPIRAHAP
jgi:hypothetical protein